MTGALLEPGRAVLTNTALCQAEPKVPFPPKVEAALPLGLEDQLSNFKATAKRSLCLLTWLQGILLSKDQSWFISAYPAGLPWVVG